MSIKNLFNSKGTPKIQKSVTSDELVAQVESEDFIDAKRQQYNQVVPHINFATASNFAKFGSAELYYEKSFERIHNYYPYDGTLHEKIQFQNSSSYLDKYIFDNIYPRTNGYVNFSGSMYITAFGGPHTASGGMTGKKFADTFENSSIYDAAKKRTSAFEFRGEDGVTIEFWLKMNAAVNKTIMHVSSSAKAGDIKVKLTSGDVLQVIMNSGSLSTVTENMVTNATTGNEWNHFAFTIKTTGSGLVFKSFKNGELAGQRVGTSAAYNISQILPTETGLNLTLGANDDGTDKLTGASIDEFRYWKKARTPEDIYNTWFIPVGGGTNKHDSNIDLGCYFKFNEGVTGNSALDDTVLDYSGRFNNGKMIGTTTGARSTSSAITEKLGLTEFKDPIIYSTHPTVVAKKAEYKTSGSLADLENSSMLYSYFPGWMQEEDEQNGKQLKHLAQIMGSYFDTLWHQIDFVNKIHDNHYISGSNKPLPFAKQLLYNQGFVMPDLFVDANILETFRQKDSNEIYEKEINEVRNTIYHNLYNNLQCIYKSKGTEKSFRNFFRSLGIGQDLVKLKMYADDSTFVLRNNYEFKSYERKFIDFNVDGHFDATLFQTSSNTQMPGERYIPADSSYTGSFSLQSEIILPRKQRKNEVNYNPFPHLSSSIMGYKEGQEYHLANGGLQVYVVRDRLESNLDPNDSHRIKFVLAGTNIRIHTDWYTGQYENNKWSLAVRMKHSSYPRPNRVISTPDDYLVEFYGVEADGNTKRNYFHLSASSLARSYYSSDKIFYAGASRTSFSGSVIYNSDIKLGYVRYWHSYLSNDAVDQHAFDSETFGTNEPFEQDVVNVYPVEIPREKTLAFHWAFNDLTGSDSSGEFMVSDLSSGSARNDYGSLSNIIQRYIPAKGIGFNASSSKVLDKNYLYSARKRLPDDLMSSDLTTIKTDETEQFFVDEDVSDNFYSFEKSMWGTISDEMMSMFSTALDLNNLIGQPNQRYHHRYSMADFLRDRFFDDVENEPDIEKFTSFYKWIDDSISIALQQLVPASARFSEKINNVIESHALERNKYVHQIPILSNFESTEGSIKGLAEMKYNWRLGHAPTLPKATASVSLNAISIGNFYNTVIRITDYNNVTKRYILQNTATSNTGTTVSLDPGSGAVNHVVVGIQGLSSTTVTAQLVTAISSANGHAGSIVATVDASDSKILRLTQSVAGPSGNTQVIAQATHVDGSALWPAHGIGTSSNFTGGSDNEQQNTLWHKERKSKTGLRETLRNSRNNHSLQSSGLIRREIDGTARISDTYAVRRFAKTYDVSMVSQETIHGGTNFGRKKNLQLFHESIAPAGALGPTSEVPQNVITVGVGTGQGIVSGSMGEYDIDDPPRKRKINFSALIGNKESNEYAYNILGNSVVPMNVMSGTITTGFNKTVHEKYKNGVYFTNLHNDVVGNYNETSIQGPFTEQHVGGLQYRHVDLNQYDPTIGRIQTQGDRPEGWGLLISAHPIASGSDDGAFGFVGADYEAPYPSTGSKKATRYRDEHAKRPVNLRNIKTVSGSWKVGNYKNELEIFQVSPTFQKSWAKRANEDPNINILPTGIAGQLPSSTHYQTLVGQGAQVVGNIFGSHNNNRQLDDSLNEVQSIAVNSAETTSDNYRMASSTTVSGYTNYTTGHKSLSFWVNLNNNTQTGRFVARAQDSSNNESFSLFFSTSSRLYYRVAGAGGTKVWRWTISYDSFVDTWRHVAIAWNGDTTEPPTLFLDGASGVAGTVQSGPDGVTTVRQPARIYLFDDGTSNSNAYELQGALQNFAIYSGSLTLANAQSIYNSGVSLNTPIRTGDLYDHWILGNENPNLSLGLSVPAGTIFSSSYGGKNNLTSSGDLTVVAGNNTATRKTAPYTMPAALNNVITIPRTDLTSSERNIVTRFSAPGGPEVQTTSYLDAYTQTYSTHNALPFRNLSVLNDSGETGTIRVVDHLGHRRGLNSLRALHMGKFGTDATYGAVSVESYPTNGSFNKQHRNTSKRMEYSGSSIITGSNHDNAFINTTMPRSELQYSWINNATSGSNAPVQRILGYAPRDGFVSSSDGYHEAIVFPTISTILGS